MLTILFNLSTTVINYAFRNTGRKPLLVKIIAHYPIGRILFKASIQVKRLSLLKGVRDPRTIENIWLMKNLKFIREGSPVLDVGCAESLLSHELIGRGFKVFALDLRDSPFMDKRVFFVKRNVIDTGLPNNSFDGIFVVSTIEHIGLEAYGQSIRDTDGDIKALKELKRILNPHGVIAITTPYIGDNPLRISANFERRYNKERLEKLIRGSRVLKEDYFYPYMRKSIHYLRVSKERIDKLTFQEEPGLACIILQKEETELSARASNPEKIRQSDYCRDC